MITKTTNRGFLIDLDLAIHEHGIPSLGPEERKTGTRPFMAVDALHGKLPSFMHDLESFFWVLFCVCAYYTAPGKGGLWSSLTSGITWTLVAWRR
jgi:hypothetical protein